MGSELTAVEQAAIELSLGEPYRLDQSWGSLWAVERHLEKLRGSLAGCSWLSWYVGGLLRRAYREIGLEILPSADDQIVTREPAYRVSIERDCTWLLAPPDPLPTFDGSSWSARPPLGIAAVPWYALAQLCQCHTWAEGNDGGLLRYPDRADRARSWLTRQHAWAVAGSDEQLNRVALQVLGFASLLGPSDSAVELDGLVELHRGPDARAVELVLRRLVAQQDQWVALTAARAMRRLQLSPGSDSERHVMDAAGAFFASAPAAAVAASVSEAASVPASAASVPEVAAPVPALAESLPAVSRASIDVPSGPLPSPFGELRLSAEPTELLLGRVRLRLPEGSFREPCVRQVGGIMGFRLVMALEQTGGLLRGGAGLNAIAFDELFVADADVDTLAARYVEDALDGRGWRIVPAVHPAVRVLTPELPAVGKTALVAVAVVKHPDGTLLSVALRVDAASAAADLPSCRRLAEAIAATVAPGDLRLLRGPLRLSSSLGGFALPVDTMVRVDRGPDFTVIRLNGLVPLGGGRRPQLDLYVGRHPSLRLGRLKPPPEVRVERIEILGREAELQRYQEEEVLRFETIVPVAEGKLLHASSTAWSAEQADLHRDIVRSLGPAGSDAVQLGPFVDLAYERAQRLDLEMQMAHAPAAQLPALQQQYREIGDRESASLARVTEQWEQIDRRPDRVGGDEAERRLLAALLEGVPEAHRALVDVDDAIASIDRRLARQLDPILHHPALQQLEAMWRGLHWLACAAGEAGAGVEVQMLVCSQEDLLQDFEDTPTVVRSGLFQQLYQAVYGRPAARPHGLVMAGYTFGPNKRDQRLLAACAEVAAAAHAPFVAAAAPSWVGVGELAEIPQDQGIDVEAEHAPAWEQLRKNPTSRHAVLVLGGVLLRLPHGWAGETSLREQIDSPADLVWGNGALALGVRLAASHAEVRWGLRIAGPLSPPGLDGVDPLEIVLSDEQQSGLARRGLVTLRPRDDSEGAELVALPTLSAPGSFKDGRNAQLPNVLVASRIAQCLKVMHREYRADWSDAATVATRLQSWLSGHVVGTMAPGGFVAGWRPFTQADIDVHDGGAHHYRFELTLVPNWAERGGSFEITLEGRLEKD